MTDTIKPDHVAITDKGPEITFTVVSPDGKSLQVINQPFPGPYADWLLDGDHWIRTKEKDDNGKA